MNLEDTQRFFYLVPGPPSPSAWEASKEPSKGIVDLKEKSKISKGAAWLILIVIYLLILGVCIFLIVHFTNKKMTSTNLTNTTTVADATTTMQTTTTSSESTSSVSTSSESTSEEETTTSIDMFMNDSFLLLMDLDDEYAYIYVVGLNADALIATYSISHLHPIPRGSTTMVLDTDSNDPYLLVCGGDYDPTYGESVCTDITHQTTVTPLNHGRSYATLVKVNQTHNWLHTRPASLALCGLVGGWTNYPQWSMTNTTEWISNNSATFGPTYFTLPGTDFYFTEGMCAAMLDDENVIFAGGYVEFTGDKVQHTFQYNFVTESLESLPDLSTARERAACEIVESSSGSRIFMITSGISSYGTTELLTIGSSTYLPGPDYPDGAVDGVFIAKWSDRKLILSGGYNGATNKIYSFSCDPDCIFTQLNTQPYSVPRNFVGVFDSFSIIDYLINGYTNY